MTKTLVICVNGMTFDIVPKSIGIVVRQYIDFCEPISVIECHKGFECGIGYPLKSSFQVEGVHKNPANNIDIGKSFIFERLWRALDGLQDY